MYSFVYCSIGWFVGSCSRGARTQLMFSDAICTANVINAIDEMHKS